MISTPVLSQRNPVWAHKQLGFSTVTVGKSGCAITVLAMLVNATHPPDEATTPAQVNTALQAMEAFGGPGRNNVTWARVPRVWPRLFYYGRIDAPQRKVMPPEMSEINRRLALDIPIIAYVDAKLQEPGLQQHFVLIVAHDPNAKDYIIADPWFGDAINLCKRYGPTPEIALCGLILYDLT